jgi:hypothetical protein
MVTVTIDDGVTDKIPGEVVVDSTEVDGVMHVVMSTDWTDLTKSVGVTLSTYEALSLVSEILAQVKWATAQNQNRVL